jgi:hypothetical protein
MIGGGYAAALGGDERMVNATGQSFEVFANAASIGITGFVAKINFALFHGCWELTRAP